MDKTTLSFHQIVELQSLLETEITKITQYKKAEQDKGKLKLINDGLKNKKALKKTLDLMNREY